MSGTKVKLVAVMMAVLLLAAACSSNNGEPSPQNESGSNNVAGNAAENAAENAPAGEQADGPLAKYDPPIEITTVKASDTNTKYLPGESAEENIWTKGYLNELGIKVKYDWIAAPGEEYNQKFNVMIASGELPDFMTVSGQQLQQLVEADMIEDLTDVYAEYASDLTKEFIEKDSPIPLKSGTIDGKLMGIPYVTASIDNAALLWVRTDWLKKLNLPEPQTMDDVLKISEAFVKQDPDGNGKADTLGLALNSAIFDQGLAGLPGFFTAYHAYPKNWVQDASGNLVYGSILPEYKTALAQLQKMYAAGELDKEFAVKDFPAVIESIVSGKIGLNFGAMWNPLSPFLDLKKKDPNSEWKSFRIPSSDGQPAKPIVSATIASFHVVKKGVEHPEALLKMINMFTDKGWGEHSDQPTYFQNNGVEVFHQAHFQTWPKGNMNVYKSINDAIASGDESKLNPDAKMVLEKIKKYQANGDAEGWAYERVFGPGGAYKSLEEYETNGLLHYNQFYGLPTKTMTERLATLDKMEAEMATKIIMGAPLEEFDKFVADWKKVGGDAMTQEVNEWYKLQQ